MKAGDLVTYAFQGVRGQIDYVGLVVETGKWTGNADVKVLWQTHTEPRTHKSWHLKVVGS